jgi:hypothetical protein
VWWLQPLCCSPVISVFHMVPSSLPTDRKSCSQLRSLKNNDSMTMEMTVSALFGEWELSSRMGTYIISFNYALDINSFILSSLNEVAPLLLLFFSWGKQHRECWSNLPIEGCSSGERQNLHSYLSHACSQICLSYATLHRDAVHRGRSRIPEEPQHGHHCRLSKSRSFNNSQNKQLQPYVSIYKH